MAENELVALIMAGGSGTRFWPASRPTLPKQYLSLVDDKPLIAATAERVRPLISPDNLYVCSTRDQAALLDRFLPEARHRVLEPEARNTAPCLMLSLARMLRDGRSRDAVMLVLPADHHIADVAGFREIARSAAQLAARTGGLVTIGIVPESPHTGYGYIEAGEPVGKGAPGGALVVRRFVEKPDRARAESFLRAKNFFWNAGIFAWKLSALEAAFEKFLPDAWARVLAARDEAALAALYPELPAAPIDTAVLEKAQSLFVIPASIGWSDIGSWNALYELRAKAKGANVVASGRVTLKESEGCLVQVPEGKRVALVGVRDLIVVEHEGVLLIADRGHDQLVKQVATEDPA